MSHGRIFPGSTVAALLLATRHYDEIALWEKHFKYNKRKWLNFVIYIWYLKLKS